MIVDFFIMEAESFCCKFFFGANFSLLEKLIFRLQGYFLAIYSIKKVKEPAFCYESTV